MRELELNGRKYWIVSDPYQGEWRASVVECIDSEGKFTEPVGIEATGETWAAADAAAERKLRRLLQLPSED
jgi:hypothetical protein